MKRTAGILLVVAALLGASCGDDGEDGGPVTGAECDRRVQESSFKRSLGEDVEAYGIVVNSDLSVGPNRLLVGVLDSNDAPIGSPEMDVSMKLFDICESTEEPVASTDTDFIWTIEPVQGVFVGRAEFDDPGAYGAEITIEGDGIEETVRTPFEVKPRSSTPAIGAPAPSSDTKTLDDVNSIELLTTDQSPDRSFYELSIADAVAAGEPFVVVFSTPKFCTSAVCGPTLDIVKGVEPDHPDANFVHVEVYELPADVSNLKTVPAVGEWGLPSEPWVFVVGADGNIVAKFEGGVGADELDAVLGDL
jgi:hypothetical protein